MSEIIVSLGAAKTKQGDECERAIWASAVGARKVAAGFQQLGNNNNKTILEPCVSIQKLAPFSPVKW